MISRHTQYSIALSLSEVLAIQKNRKFIPPWGKLLAPITFNWEQQTPPAQWGKRFLG